MAGRNADAIRKLDKIVERHALQFEQVEGRTENLEAEIQRLRDQSDSRQSASASLQADLRAIDERVKQLERIRELRWTIFVAVVSVLGTLLATLVVSEIRN